MAGRIIRVARAVYSANLQANQKAVFAIGPRSIDTTDVVSGTLIVRASVDAVNSVMPLLASAKVNLNNVSITPEEPQTIFAWTLGGSTSLAGVTLLQADIASWPQLYYAGFNTSAAQQMVMTLTLLTGANAGLVSVVLGVDAVLRDQ